MFLPISSEAPIVPPLIQIVIEEKKEEPKQPELTWKDNPNDCDESIEWIAEEEPFYCIPHTRSVSRTSGASSSPQTTNRPTSTLKQATGGNTYARGYCTWFVKNQLSWIPNGLGNANTWAFRASSYGLGVYKTPTVGSVAQTSSGPLGHVAIVVGVNGDQVTVQEMNYRGWNVISSRTVSASSFVYIR